MKPEHRERVEAAFKDLAIPVGDLVLQCDHDDGKSASVMEMHGTLMWVFTCRRCYRKPGVQLGGGPATEAIPLDPGNMPEVMGGRNGRGRWTKRPRDS